MHYFKLRTQTFIKQMFKHTVYTTLFCFINNEKRSEMCDVIVIQNLIH